MEEQVSKQSKIISKKNKTMKRITAILTGIILIGSLNLHAQISQERQVGDFTGIHQSTSADVFISNGDRNMVTVKADEHAIDKLTTKVKNGILYIEVEGSIRNARTLEVYITMKRIDYIKNSGSGNIRCSGGIPGNDVKISINGSGDLEANLEANNMEINISGSGDVELLGVRGDFNLSVSGSGDVEAGELQLENCKVSIQGSGDVRLKGATANLLVKQNGSGDVNAYGLKAVAVDVNNSGSGDIVVQAANSLRAMINGSGDLTYHGAPEKVDVMANGSGEIYRK
jgi:preprotein translocase subunit SecG